MATNSIENEIVIKRSKTRVILLVFYIVILLFLYFYLTDLKFNPTIVILLLVFFLLIGIGVFLKQTKGSLYSRMFPEKKRKSSINKQQKMLREKQEKRYQQRIPTYVNLNSQYHKPLITKCPGCGNILPNFVKKCPFCNKQLT